MKEETKDKAKDVAQELTEKAAEWLKEGAKSSTGIMRWVYGILFILTMGALAVFFSACENITPEQMHRAHDAWHVLTGKDCILVLPVEDCKK